MFSSKMNNGYRVNDFFREYIMSRPVEETTFFPVEVSALEKQGHGRLTTEGIGHHLAIGSTWDDDQTVFESFDLSRLRSLTVFNNRQFRSYYLSNRMRVLRFLDLQNEWAVCGNNIKDVQKLPSRLKFLSLRGLDGITELPDSVRELVQLQTLDIRGTKIRTLPPFITRLRKLQYIRAGTTVPWTHDTEEEEEWTLQSSKRWWSCIPNKILRRGGPVFGFGARIGGVEVPRGIKGLEALHTLGAVCVNTADGAAILDEIVYSLPQLKKLQVSGISLKHRERTLFRLACKPHLESLSLQLEANNHSLHRKQNIYIPTSLRSLKVVGHIEQLPRRIEGAVNLGKLTLEMTNALLKAEVLQQLERLPSLHTLRLRIRKDEQDGELRFPSALFSKLQVLEIACKSKLDVSFEHGAMEKLEQLKVHCLEGSQMQFSGLDHPVSLKQVWLLGSFDDTLKAALEQQLDRHQKIPPPKLEVQRRWW